MYFKTIKLIYLGGTFGCHGTPLKPLNADIFLPQLLKNLPQVDSLMEVVENDLIKDSSQFTLADFLATYQLVLTQYHLGYRKFIVITGTDSLSYLSSFLAECFVGSDILLNVTASMMPLFDPQRLPLQIDQNSDAWGNFQGAINHVQKDINGVYVCFDKHNYLAQTVKKQHSHSINAFVGENVVDDVVIKNYFCLDDADRQAWTTQRLSEINQLQNGVNNLAIASIFVMPNDVSVLEMQLQALLSQTDKDMAIILLGLGAGNIPYSQLLAELFEQAYSNGQMIVASTQCSFGGVSDSYLAGSWQYEHHIISGQDLTIETIFARLLWIYANYSSFEQRRQAWNTLIN